MKKLWDITRWLVTTLAIFALIPLLPIIYLLRLIMFGKPLQRIALLLAAILVVALIFLYVVVSEPLGNSTATYSVTLCPRDNGADLRERLQEAGIETDRRIYNLMMRWTGAERNLKPGRYEFSGGISHYELAKLFRDTPPELNRVTIPEGETIREIAPLLVQNILTDSAELERLLNDESFGKALGIEAPSLEGYLFPETYSFAPYQEPDEILKAMVATFFDSFDPDMKRQMESLKMQLNEIVTLASMIEAEAADGAERNLISSVFHNRLRKGWKLQCDPTVIYALGGLDRPLLRKDLDYDSPYNTYLYYGLPPGAIGSPGLASLRAALFPAETDYYYFVATGDGKHVFTSTLAQHNRAVSRTKRSRR